MCQMPNYILGGTGQGVKTPSQIFVIKEDGNFYFRAILMILTGVEVHYFEIHQAICDFIQVHYNDLNIFLAQYEDSNAHV